MRFGSESEMRVLSLRERLVANGDRYLRQPDGVGAEDAGSETGPTVREETGRSEDLRTGCERSAADHARPSAGAPPRRSRA